jgi:hypothetical protein
MSNWLTVVTTIAGLIVGGLVTYFTSRATLRNQAEHAFDQTLRELRLPQYRALFHLTEAVPRQWILTNPPNREELLVLRKRFHEWYFSEQAGGMLLSQAARQAYFGLQNELQEAASHISGEERISEPSSSILRSMASTLRHQLSADLGAAEPPRRRSTTPKSISPPQA